MKQIKNLVTQVIKTIRNSEDSITYKVTTYDHLLIIGYTSYKAEQTLTHYIHVILETLEGEHVFQFKEESSIDLSGEELALMISPYLHKAFTKKKTSELKRLRKEAGKKLGIKNSLRDSILLVSDLVYYTDAFYFQPDKPVELKLEIDFRSRTEVSMVKEEVHIEEGIWCAPTPVLTDPLMKKRALAIIQQHDFKTIDDLLSIYPKVKES